MYSSTNRARTAAATFVLGGLAIHEDDTLRLQRSLDSLVIEHLARVPLNLDEYELHAAEMRSAKKPGAQRPASIWAKIPRSVRLALLEDAYRRIATFRAANSKLPAALFGVVVDSRFRSDWKPVEKEQFAHEVLLNEFEVMLKNFGPVRNCPTRAW